MAAHSIGCLPGKVPSVATIEAAAAAVVLFFSSRPIFLSDHRPPPPQTSDKEMNGKNGGGNVTKISSVHSRQHSVVAIIQEGTSSSSRWPRLLFSHLIAISAGKFLFSTSSRRMHASGGHSPANKHTHLQTSEINCSGSKADGGGSGGGGHYRCCCQRDKSINQFIGWEYRIISLLVRRRRRRALFDIISPKYHSSLNLATILINQRLTYRHG
jgi:hypothetical protein